MSYLLDSDVTADYLKGLPQPVQHIGTLVQIGIAISIITYGEIYDGVAGSDNPSQQSRSSASSCASPSSCR